jgi:GntR family transcriptional regulator
MTPIYMRVADRLEAEISKRTPGTELPSENELARTYRISRLTARASLEELERRCLVRRSQGKRTLVARRIDYVIGPERSPSWSEGVKLSGATPRSQTERLQLRKAPAAIRAALHIDARTPTLFLARKRFVDGELAAVADTWLVADLVPMLAERLAPDASLHDILSRVYRLTPRRAWSRAQFVIAPSAIARRLDLEGRPFVLRLTGVAVSHKLGRPIEITTSWLRADVFNVVFEMGRPL